MQNVQKFAKAKAEVREKFPQSSDDTQGCVCTEFYHDTPGFVDINPGEIMRGIRCKKVIWHMDFLRMARKTAKTKNFKKV